MTTPTEKISLAGNSIGAMTVIGQLLRVLEEKGILSRRDVDNLLMQAADLQCEVRGIPSSPANHDAREVILHLMRALQNNP